MSEPDCAANADANRHEIPREHPRLLGSRARLQKLAKDRADDYSRTVEVARLALDDRDDPLREIPGRISIQSKLISMGLVSAIEADQKLARETVDLALREIVYRPIRMGHIPFGTDVALGALVYDLCHEAWTPEERTQFHAYMNQNCEANAREEGHVFHNGWYGYKNWGFGMGSLATMFENPRAAEVFEALDHELRTRASPALNFAGEGGGWAEGYYLNYWINEWLFFCEAARHCTGINYYALAPKFYRQYPVAGMFEQFPGICERNSRRPMCVGDGRGRFFKIERDKAFASRNILIGSHRTDLDCQAVQAYSLQTPRCGALESAYRDFLWFDRTVPARDLQTYKLSHFSRGPGHVYARSSWDEDATWFFFKCGARFTSHQHLDVGHFYIYKHAELASEGGHYDTFGGDHDVNFYTRTIAHNTILVHDPAETWPVGMRFFKVRTGNDGGQAFPWQGTSMWHNGGAADLSIWHQYRSVCDIAQMLAYEDAGPYVYAAGDCSRAYAAHKLAYFTRQIVFIRPGTFVIFDRVRSKNPNFKKTWLLHAMKTPAGQAPNLVITHGGGRLFMQTLLPTAVQVKLCERDELYSYGGTCYPPAFKTGIEPECRIELSPQEPAEVDYFLHVLTATDAATGSVPQATAQVGAAAITVKVGEATLVFLRDTVGAAIEFAGSARVELKNNVPPLA